MKITHKSTKVSSKFISALVGNDQIIWFTESAKSRKARQQPFLRKKFFLDVKNLESPPVKQLVKDLILLGGVSFYKTCSQHQLFFLMKRVRPSTTWKKIFIKFGMGVLVVVCTYLVRASTRIYSVSTAHIEHTKTFVPGRFQTKKNVWNRLKSKFREKKDC